MPDVFSDDCATSESLCYAQRSIPEQFGVRGKQISDFRDFLSSPCSWLYHRGRLGLPPEHRRGWGRCQEPRKACETIFLMTLRPRNHFVTLRIAFGRSLRPGASRYLTIVIFGDFELSAVPWQRPGASIPPCQSLGTNSFQLNPVYPTWRTARV